MITGDPKRTPSLALFGNHDFWLSSGPSKCGTSCFSEPKGGDAWNHGDVGSQINTTWLGLAGPGIAHQGVNNSTWSDHTDIQPTMLALLGLRDDYTPDGRVLGEVISRAALPPGMRPHPTTLLKLGQVYTQLEAAVGSFGLGTLRGSTQALASHSAGDATYTKLESQLRQLGNSRDVIAGKMRAMLLAAAFSGQPVNVPQANRLIAQGNRLLHSAAKLGAAKLGAAKLGAARR
jgi:hypothetical protein